MPRGSSILWGIFLTLCGLSTLGLLGLELVSRQGPDFGLAEHVSDDWPDGDHSDKDRWRSGTIYGFKADRIRRVARPKEGGVDSKSNTFYMSVPMSKGDLSALLHRLEKDKKYEFRVGGSFPKSNILLSPDWFPDVSQENFIGFAKDDGSWWVYMFRPTVSDHTFFVLK